jgi:DNA-binding CsgD family transcriptional regulator
VDPLAAARAASLAGDWPAAARGYAAAREAGLAFTPDDDLAHSDAAWWLGDNATTIAATERAWTGYLAAGRTADAAMAALSLAGILFLRGDDGPGGGWFARAERLIDELPEGVPHGYLAYVTGVEGGLATGDVAGAREAARRVRAIGEATGDSTLVACGLMGEGRAWLAEAEVAKGFGLVDEAMLLVAGGAVRPEFAGSLYCDLMSACNELGDIPRARTWTEATVAWVAALPAAVMFTGVCRVHRSQLLQLGGAWDEAEAEAGRVVRDLAELNIAAAAEGWYQVGELRRLRGDHDGAEAAYRNAHERGRDPQPGIALLRLAQGRVEAAAAGLRVALASMPPDHGRLRRARLLAAQVEVAGHSGDAVTAAEGAGELRDIALAYRSPAFTAAAAHALGRAALLAGRPTEAIGELQAALRRWLDLDAPYEAACVRRSLAEALKAAGDAESAARHRDAAATAFGRLGAAAGVPDAVDRDGAARPGGLTDRETEVLAIVATGRSNREVADALGLSEKTVARHLANIFTKLDVASRTEAAAFAFEHGLAGPKPAGPKPAGPRPQAG